MMCVSDVGVSRTITTWGATSVIIVTVYIYLIRLIHKIYYSPTTLIQTSNNQISALSVCLDTRTVIKYSEIDALESIIYQQCWIDQEVLLKLEVRTFMPISIHISLARLQKFPRCALVCDQKKKQI